MRRAIVIIVLVACGPRRVTEPPPPRGSADAGVAAAPADAAPPDAPRALADDLPRLAAGVADMMVALGDALAIDADCATLAAAAQGVLADHLEVRTAHAAAADRGAGRELDRALEAHADRITAAAAKLRPAIAACHGNADFAAAVTPVDVR